MATPLYSIYVRTVFPRGVVFELSAMGADPTQEDPTNDFALQLLLEARHQAGLTPAQATIDTEILDELYKEMLPCSLTLPTGDPAVEHATTSGEQEGRKLLSVESSDGGIVLHLERNYRAFCNAAQHYIYYVMPTETSRASDEEGSGLVLAIAGRFPWLFSVLRPGMHWESTAYSFAMYA